MNRRGFILKVFGAAPLIATTSVIPTGSVLEIFATFEEEYQRALDAEMMLAARQWVACIEQASVYAGGVTWVDDL